MLSGFLTILDHEDLADTSLARCIYCQEILLVYCCNITHGKPITLYFAYEREPDALKILYWQTEACKKENGMLGFP